MNIRYDNTISAMLLGLALVAPPPAHADEESGVWLGVQLAPVPSMLDVHLQLDGKGLMVRNVYTDSPADQAGIERYDVITEVNGQSVSEGAGDFSKHVRQRKVGDELSLTVVHGGQRKSFTVVLEARTRDWSQIEPKYRDDPDLSHSREYDLRGHILKPGPEGWTWYDLGEMPEMFDLFVDPDSGDLTTRMRAREPEHFEARHVDEDGNIIHVSRKHNGVIVVTRIKEGQTTDQAEVKEYLSLDELEEKDPEAAKLVDKLEVKPGRPHVRYFNEPRRPLLPEWRQQFRKLIPGPGQLSPKSPPGIDFDLSMPPRTTFDVKPDGTIDVRVQSEDSELQRTFESADELRESAPKLYQKYERLHGQLR